MWGARSARPWCNSGMDAIDIIARLIGAFYAFGGVMTLRAIAMDAILDKALASITLGRPDPEEDLRRRVLTGLSIVTAASGGALLLLGGLATWLFLLNLGLQAGWLVWAKTRFPPEDEDDARGRRQSARAAAVWAGATAIVLWLEFAGRLGPLTDLWVPLALTVGAGVMLAWILPHLTWKPGPTPAFGEEPDGRAVIVPPRRVRLALRYGFQTLWDAEDGRALNPFDHLPEALAERLLAWENAFHDATDPYDPDAGPAFSSTEAERHEAEGLAIAAELRALFGSDAVDGPFIQHSPGSGELSAG